ncbi:hypothetical protein COY05_04005 [Candidatus Peregrinibacteria bacterium CG_4_10_14_0_2_um_filter_38_24]|nr:MAG: hypothetical protein COY05_04005 [Candidatus Peregrinibacteria bacterium CG_4_10_14_0_2_um_filter_38_24]PJC38502.1 MAG: hypothetical protein CO044_04665 [Candidatus Peregrinibacteria bacterium CG_4_9_14_0_2_um_filter_38_9]
MKKISLLILVLILSIFMSNVSFAKTDFPPELANMKKTLETSLKSAPISECRQRLTPLLDIETLEFLKFLETNFQNKSADTTLLNTAIAKYMSYKKGLNKFFGMVTLNSNVLGNMQSTEYTNYVKCREIMDMYISLAKQKLMNYMKSNSVQKKATMLVEKYKGIGNKLKDLNDAIAQMYGYFATFKNKSPGFLNKCVTN